MDAIPHEICVSPQLRRTMILNLATHAIRLRADFSLVSPKDVRWTDEPMLMRRVDAKRVAAESENARPANERSVVEIDDVETVIEQLRKSVTLKNWSPCLLNDQW